MWKINIYSLKTHLTRSGQSDQIPKQDQNRPTEKLKQKFRQATFLIGESSVEGKCLAWLSFQAGVFHDDEYPFVMCGACWNLWNLFISALLSCGKKCEALASVLRRRSSCPEWRLVAMNSMVTHEETPQPLPYHLRVMSVAISRTVADAAIINFLITTTLWHAKGKHLLEGCIWELRGERAASWFMACRVSQVNEAAKPIRCHHYAAQASTVQGATIPHCQPMMNQLHLKSSQEHLHRQAVGATSSSYL